MRILLGNNTLSLLAGSESWTRTLAFQLKKMGHTVEGFSPDLGIVAEELREKGIPCHDNIATSGVKPFSILLEEKRTYDYDVIISNHFLITEYLRMQFPKVPIISTVHGILHTFEQDGRTLPAPEHPALTANVSQFVSVSEEIQKKLKDDYNLDSMIIRNFFDCEHFTAKRDATSGSPKSIMINTNYASKDSPEILVLKEVAKHYDAKLIAVGANFAQTKDSMQAIEEADVVFGMGRSVLEGVCAGRLGFVHGRWGTGGVICQENIDELRYYNFSGRNAPSRDPLTAEEIIALIDQYYKPEVLEWGKNYIRREHNVEFAAETYLQTAKALLAPDALPADGIRVIPYRLEKDVQPTA